ncbi:MAG TPA: gamma-glutamyl-gamma-aminobutyrate hydrolase family protein [Frankiaceae bacterium]|jgi:gamma-glutamyl-gamma-aminobutyrate hydrolase PuuD|nr:gamma-glutamyl-gamma-aminobutyrate hydrolase family protein [Frankiaceae bacterium]
MPTTSPARAVRVGLTSYREPAVWGVWNEPADLLPASYADAVAAAGAVPMLLPAVSGFADLDRAAVTAVEGLDGLVLSGGPDVDPARYEAAPDPRTGAPRTERDAWEIALTAAALRRDMPLLGVCRGMQVLAVALGGTLVQHLPDEVGSEVHCPTVGVHGRHPVSFAPGSRLGAVLGTQTEVATYHHQGVDTLPAATKAIGWAPDGTVEAFEVCGAAWAFGVQWHPEVHDGQALFADFVAACAGQR